MSSTSVTRQGQLKQLEVGEFGEVYQAAKVTISARQLLPGELDASLPSQASVDGGLGESLTRVLGPALTTASLAWLGDPVPRMRALQKHLLGFSLAQPQEQRMPVMQAIAVIETSIQWRLRYQQMRMADAEAQAQDDTGNKDDQC